MANPTGPKVGAEAPDFTLKDQDGKEVHLRDLRGKKVLLSFHPLAFTGVCTRQMMALEAGMEELEGLGVVPLGISVDSHPTKKVWAASLGLKRLRILSDFHPKGGAARSLDLYIEDNGIDARANVLLDEQGKVAWTKVYDIPQLPDLGEVIAAARKA
jgi:peroxiredoxin